MAISVLRASSLVAGEIWLSNSCTIDAIMFTLPCASGTSLHASSDTRSASPGAIMFSLAFLSSDKCNAVVLCAA